MLAVLVVILVADVVDLLKGALLGQLVKATGVEQGVDVLAVLEALAHHLQVLLKVGVVDVQVAAAPYRLLLLLLHRHLSHSLKFWHIFGLSFKVFNARFGGDLKALFFLLHIDIVSCTQDRILGCFLSLVIYVVILVFITKPSKCL